ncbi:MAG: DUF4115 domain-containing protein [Synergistaceae bacterium]|nr:DUF4115 domain-containing protein [Synergistaceae bacterium]
MDEPSKEILEEEKLIKEAEEKKAKFVSLGMKLKKLREAQGISVSDVANHTKIQKHFIASIEEGKFDKLPKGPYLRGFLRQYCAYLSADDLWNTYDALTKEKKVLMISPTTKQEQVVFSVKPKIFKPTPVSLIYFVVVVSVLAAVFITWQFRSSMPFTPKSPMDVKNEFVILSEDIQSDAISVDVFETSADASIDLGWMDGLPSSPVVLTKTVDSEQAPQTSVTKGNELKIIPTAVVWIKVSRANKILFEGIIKPDEDKSFTVTEEAPLRVKSGKPGKTSLEWQGKKIESMGDNKVPIVRFYWFDGQITETNKK